ncbi:MAG: archease [Candidatus Micrarchaeota archaeon]|nr:archease [Candidatus Micrarchaeota archaeon]
MAPQKKTPAKKKAGRHLRLQKKRSPRVARASKKKTAARPKPAARRASAHAPKAKPAIPSFRYLEHTGDIMIEAFGPDFPTALSQAAYAMFKVMGPAKPVAHFEVDESALNRDELVVYFLSRVLSEVEARELVPAKIEILHFSSGPAWRVQARIWGESKRPRDAIKAVTFHELAVEDDLKTGWRIQVLLDV